MKITGKILRGKREGTKIGFPTANIMADKDMKPGIYTGYASVPAGNSTRLEAIFYISDKNNRIAECHILDFPKKDLYDLKIEVDITYRLRNVQDFTDLDEARRQIKEDELEAREWFKESKKA